MTRSRSTRILVLAAGAAFLALLDVTVVNLAIPALGRAYRGSDVTELSWVITAYATLFAALLAPAGRLADVIGRRTLYRVGVTGFALMSLACALAPSLPLLLVARGLQGAMAALMIPASLAILLADTPAEQRTKSVALWSAAGALAAAVGPSLGGVLVHAFGWRSLFVINVPTGLALAAAAGVLPRPVRAHTRLPDAFGTVLLASGIGLVALGLSQSGVWGWGDARTIACLAGGVASIVAALQRSWRMPVPAIDTSLWKHRTFAFANVASLLYGASLYAGMLLGVLVLTELWHYSELQAGLAMTPGAISASVAAVAASRIRSPRNGVIAGALLMAGTGLVLAATLPTQPDFLGYWLPLGLLLGAGMGLVTTGTSTAAALSLPPRSFAAGNRAQPDGATGGRSVRDRHPGDADRLNERRDSGDLRARLPVLRAGRGGRRSRRTRARVAASPGPDDTPSAGRRVRVGDRVEVTLGHVGEGRVQLVEDARRPAARPGHRREVVGQLGVDHRKAAELVHDARAGHERVAVRQRGQRAPLAQWRELAVERLVALDQAAQIPGARDERRQPDDRVGVGGEQRRVIGYAQLGEQPDDLGRVVVGRDPDAALHRAEAEEPQPPRQAGELESAVLGDLVPEHGPGPLVIAGVTEREDPHVALGQQPVSALGQAVVHQPAVADALDQPVADETGQRHPGGALGEAELAEQDHQAAGPDAVAEGPHVGAEQRDRELLGLDLLARGKAAVRRHAGAGAGAGAGAAVGVQRDRAHEE